MKTHEIMMKNIIYIVAILFFTIGFSQDTAFKDGELLSYKMSYSGFLSAGEANIKLTEKNFNGKRVFHAEGTGETSTVVGWFFKVRDRYESYFDAEKVTPYKFIRDVKEGGYKLRRDIEFKNNKAYIKDYTNKNESIKAAFNVQDMISSFYYLRNYDTSSMKKGDEITINMFFDSNTYPFKMKYLGDQILDTKFGKVKTKIFRPIVMSGRVFKAKESVTIWVTADKNKIPIFLKADLAVGSLRANLKGYKGLANPFIVVK